MGFFDSKMDSDTIKQMTETPFDTINLLFLFLSEQLILKSKIGKHIAAVKSGECEDPSFKTNDMIAQFVSLSYFIDKEKTQKRVDFGKPLYEYDKVFNTMSTIEWDFIKINKTYLKKHTLVEAKIVRNEYATIEIKMDTKFKFYQKEIKEIIDMIEDKFKDESGSPKYMCFSNGPELTILTKNAEEIIKITQRGFKMFVYGKVDVVLVSMPGAGEIFNLIITYVQKKMHKSRAF
ncbi:hypothetical protein KAU33_12075 [Candidatus Dependentiae bacterium]|nr:hypothetical protein [Candidatus Dependentiae bacterium]